MEPRVILITGASSGIGHAAARALDKTGKREQALHLLAQLISHYPDHPKTAQIRHSYELLQKLDFTVDATALPDDIWPQLRDTLAPLENAHGARISITLQNASINAQGRLHLPAAYRIDHENLQRLETLLAAPQVRRHY